MKLGDKETVAICIQASVTCYLHVIHRYTRMVRTIRVWYTKLYYTRMVHTIRVWYKIRVWYRTLSTRNCCHGDQTTDAYSNLGLIRALYARSFTYVEATLMFLRKSPKIELVPAIVSSICLFHLRFDCKIAPKYLQ